MADSKSILQLVIEPRLSSVLLRSWCLAPVVAWPHLSSSWVGISPAAVGASQRTDQADARPLPGPRCVAVTVEGIICLRVSHNSWQNLCGRKCTMVVIGVVWWNFLGFSPKHMNLQFRLSHELRSGHMSCFDPWMCISSREKLSELAYDRFLSSCGLETGHIPYIRQSGSQSEGK